VCKSESARVCVSSPFLFLSCPNPAPCILRPKPQTQPQTLHPAPCTLNAQPQNQNPAPCTLNMPQTRPLDGRESAFAHGHGTRQPRRRRQRCQEGIHHRLEPAHHSCPTPADPAAARRGLDGAITKGSLFQRGPRRRRWKWWWRRRRWW
jgi:hypothetical protein